MSAPNTATGHFQTFFRWKQYATRYVFLVLGMAISAWAVLVPYAKASLTVNEAQLGMLLLLIGIGALLAIFIAGKLTNHFGCRKTLNVSTTVFLISLVALAFTTNTVLFGVLLLIFGLSSGVIDIAMNIQASLIERRTNRRLMSGFHGMYSAGGFFGALIVSMLLKVGLAITWSMTILCLVMLLGLMLIFQRYLDPTGMREAASHSAIRLKGIVVFLGLLCGIFYMADGTILDWGALFMMGKGCETEMSGLAFSVFSVATAIGRLKGDRLLEAFGVPKVIAASGVVAIIGFAVILMTSGTWFSLAGFTIIGLGVSNLIPILFSYISRQKEVPVSQALSTVTTLGYLGLMAGPPAMGHIAHQHGLYAVFGTVACMVLAAAIAGWKVLR
ncbi:MAG: MFS transporter [Oxalobacter sp.]|nr:MFS transporter [Oxalobacter sp.]